MRRCFRIGAFCAAVSLALCAEDTHATSTLTPSTLGNGSAIGSISTVVEVVSKPLGTDVVPSVTSSVSTHSTGTCQSKTANYITHTLPQQCLRSRSETALATGINIVYGSEHTNSSGGEISTISSSEVGTISTAAPDEPTATSATIITESTSLLPEADADAESPLDNANFLSFEDWKKQNLEKAGQSPENLGQGRAAAGTARKRPDVGGLESLGEEGEIDFDFGGFVGMDKPSDSSRPGSASAPSDAELADQTSEASAQLPSYMRSKDAGKTCKERYNYASFDCGASMLKTNARCKSSASVLVENKDSYMLNECAVDNKFLIVELCEDILVDTVVLANFEFFSSMVRTFRVSVSDRYPPKPGQWVELGTFEARNSREVQAFLIEGPRVWARYLRVELLTHYGNEYYCPVSLLRVHGITMMEEYKHEEERARGEVEEEEVHGIEEVAGGAEKVVTAEAIVLQEAASSSASASASSTPVSASTQDAVETPQAGTDQDTAGPSQSNASSTSTAIRMDSSALGVPSNHTDTTIGPRRSAPSEETQAAVGSNISAEATNNGSALTSISETARTVNTPVNSTAESKVSTRATGDAVEPEATQQTQTGSTHTNATADLTIPSNSTDSVPVVSSSTTDANSTSTHAATPAEKSKPVSAVAQPPAPSPSTQESFFKSVDKRLKALESNASLSLQYIEEQSRILRDAFTKVEKRQLNKTAAFLAHLNATVMTELRTFRTQYDQLWQSTVIELETHREQYQREIVAISSRLTLLADEVVFQKRMAVVQSTLLMLCLGFVLFVRSGTGTLELPLMHSVMGRHAQTQHGHGHDVAHKRAMTEPFDSPPDSPARPTSPASGPQSERRSRISRFFSRPGSRGGGSPASIRSTPAVEISAPTPVDRSPLAGQSLNRDDSPDSLLDADGDIHDVAHSIEQDEDTSPTDVDVDIDIDADADADAADEDADGDGTIEDSSSAEDMEHVHLQLRQVRSGPATPQGTRDAPLAWDPAPSGLRIVSGAGYDGDGAGE